jgi:hypothetical protein
VIRFAEDSISRGLDIRESDANGGKAYVSQEMNTCVREVRFWRKMPLNSVLIIVALICFLASAGSFYRNRTLPPDKKLGSHGFYVDREAYRWYGVLGFFLGVVVLAASFIL